MSIEITERRKQIDAIDAELILLLNRRAQLAIEIGELKQVANLPIYDQAREQEILAKACAVNAGPLDARALTHLFQCIINETRSIEARLNAKADGEPHGAKR